MTFRSNALSLPPQEAARRLSLAFLDEAASALERLRSGDSDALHDFRVALRRLRSILRAYAPYLEDTVEKKMRRRARDLSRATGLGRDAEVQVEWLRSLEDAVSDAESAGLEWLTRRLEERRKAAYGEVEKVIYADFARLERSLRKRLGVYLRRVEDAESSRQDSFRDVAGRLVREQASELASLLGEIRSADATTAQHEARIAAKRLRYLVEPFAGMTAGALELVGELKHLQDVLGEIRDLHVLRESLATARNELGLAVAGRPAAAARKAPARRKSAAARKAPPRRKSAAGKAVDLIPGFERIEAACDQRSRDLYEDLRSRFLDDHAAELRQRADDVARGITSRAPVAGPALAPGAGVEIERKYLLRSLPPCLKGAARSEITQGWVPASVVEERLRRERGEDGESYFRTFTIGLDIRRIEVEEEIPRKIFEALWRFTRGMRVRKKRYRKIDGRLVWVIDDFSDRDLVLAEVELPAAGVVPEMPAWLAPSVEREVTGEAEYYDVRLAR